MLERFRQWRRNGVRGVGPGMRSSRGWYFKWTPQWGACINSFHGSKIRVAKHHGIQRIVWVNERWVVGKQLLGRSTVVKERYVADVRG